MAKTKDEAQIISSGNAVSPQGKYKDRLFRMIFREKEELLNLYNAVNGTDYDNPDDLEVNTLENAIYMNMKNDISFIFQAELNLYEHQSTFNPNIPLRNLGYIARELEKLTVQDSLYRSTQVKIPTPRFIVFYNGTAEQPERKVLKLSDAYEKFIEEPELELKVLMLNINQGKNRDIMEKCRVLREYMLFVARVRKYAAADGIERAVNRAVNECIREGVLKEFLLKNKAEAIQMSIFEYDEEREKELLKKAYLEEGEARGRQIGEEVGEARGRQVGEEIGEARGKVECILTVLSEKGEVPDNLRQQVCVQQDSRTLTAWLKLALKADTVEEFWRKMNDIEDK